METNTHGWIKRNGRVKIEVTISGCVRSLPVIWREHQLSVVMTNKIAKILVRPLHPLHHAA